MSKVPSELRYTREHEWARLADGADGADEADGGSITIGITDFAQEQLGDIVYLELPAEGSEVQQGQALGEIESTKSVSDVFSPVSGVVEKINAAGRDNPEVVNQDPYGEGWLVAITPSDPGAFAKLMSADEYTAFLESEAGEDHV